MNLEQYLESEEAVADVAALLEQTPTPSACVPGTSFAMMDDWVVSVVDAIPWKQVYHRKVETGRGDVHIYFRPEGDRFIVTDLGEAVRALRLRTGRLRADAGPALKDGRIERVAVANGEQIIAIGHDCEHDVSAADLPRALCRVLLAAHRVASLEVP